MRATERDLLHHEETGSGHRTHPGVRGSNQDYKQAYPAAPARRRGGDPFPDERVTPDELPFRVIERTGLGENTLPAARRALLPISYNSAAKPRLGDLLDGQSELHGSGSGQRRHVVHVRGEVVAPLCDHLRERVAHLIAGIGPRPKPYGIFKAAGSATAVRAFDRCRFGRERDRAA